MAGHKDQLAAVRKQIKEADRQMRAPPSTASTPRNTPSSVDNPKSSRSSRSPRSQRPEGMQEQQDSAETRPDDSDNSEAESDLGNDSEEEGIQLSSSLDGRGLDKFSAKYIHEQALVALAALEEHILRASDDDPPHALFLATYLTKYLSGVKAYLRYKKCWENMHVGQRNAGRTTTPVFNVIALLPIAMKYREYWLNPEAMWNKINEEATAEYENYLEELARYEELGIRVRKPENPREKWNQRGYDMEHWVTWVTEYPFIYYVAEYLNIGIFRAMLLLFHTQHDKGRNDDVASVNFNLQKILRARFPQTGTINSDKAFRGYNDINTARAIVPKEFAAEMRRAPNETMNKFKNGTYKHVGGDLPAFMFASSIGGNSSMDKTFALSEVITQVLRCVWIGERSLDTGAFLAQNCNAVKHKVFHIKYRHFVYACWVALYCLTTTDKMVLVVGSLDLVKFHNTLIAIGHRLGTDWHVERERFWNLKVFGSVEGRASGGTVSTTQVDEQLGRWTTSQLLLRSMGISFDDDESEGDRSEDDQEPAQGSDSQDADEDLFLGDDQVDEDHGKGEGTTNGDEGMARDGEEDTTNADGNDMLVDKDRAVPDAQPEEPTSRDGGDDTEEDEPPLKMAGSRRSLVHTTSRPMNSPTNRSQSQQMTDPLPPMAPQTTEPELAQVSLSLSRHSSPISPPVQGNNQLQRAPTHPQLGQRAAAPVYPPKVKLFVREPNQASSDAPQPVPSQARAGTRSSKRNLNPTDTEVEVSPPAKKPRTTKAKPTKAKETKPKRAPTKPRKSKA